MAARKTAAAAPAEEIIERIDPQDPWKRMVEIVLPRGAEKDSSIWVCVNGKSWQVPMGKRIEVPEPVAEVIERSQEMQDWAAVEKERLAKG